MEAGAASAGALRWGPGWSVGGSARWPVWLGQGEARLPQQRAPLGRGPLLGPAGRVRIELFLLQKRRPRVGGEGTRPRSSRQNEEVAQAE